MTYFEGMIELTCEARVGGETFMVREVGLEVVLNDPAAKKAIEDALRQKLMLLILERWTPVIKTRRM